MYLLPFTDHGMFREASDPDHQTGPFQQCQDGEIDGGQVGDSEAGGSSIQ